MRGVVRVSEEVWRGRGDIYTRMYNRLIHCFNNPVQAKFSQAHSITCDVHNNTYILTKH